VSTRDDDSPTVSMPALARIVAIAKEAGDAIMRHYQHDAVSDTKPDGSPLTDADRASHDIIEQRLTEWSPHVPIISEEGVIPAYDERRAWRRFWLVDPLDGTKEFLSRNDEFTVNIALIEDGEPVLGAIVAPAVHRCWFAGRGLGSWTERGGGVPTRIWSTPAPADVPLTVVESRSHPSERLERYLQSVEIARRIPAGSSIKFCLVAEGLADIYPRFGPTMEWDVAAGDCIFRNSGRDVPRRSPLVYNTATLRNGDFIVGN
jgi:3'(2'), 5'-bisphosphate nucleotidase